MSKTLNEMISELETLKQIHGGDIDVVTSKGPVTFKAVTFSEKDKFFLDVADTIVLETADGERL